MGVEHDGWSNLHWDLLHEIAERVDSYADYVRLRAVCKVWNQELPKVPREIKIPWLVFRTGNDNPFYSFGEERAYPFKLSEMNETLIVGSCDGWLITVSIDGEIQMLNPFTKARITLPPMSTVPDVIAYHPEKQDNEYTVMERLFRIGAEYPQTMSKSLMQKTYIVKAIIISSPSSTFDQDQDFMVMVIYGLCKKLAYCKSGDKKWTRVPVTEAKPIYEDAIYHQGKIYAVNAFAEFCEIDIESGVVNKVQFPVAVTQVFDFYRKFPYVVGTPYGVILVIRYVELIYLHYPKGKTYGFDIYRRLSHQEGEWSRVNNLGDYVLILGYNSSVCMLPHAFPDQKGNRIYYTNDFMQYDFSKTKYDVGYFDLEDETAHDLFPRSLASSLNAKPFPIWLLYKAT